MEIHAVREGNVVYSEQEPPMSNALWTLIDGAKKVADLCKMTEEMFPNGDQRERFVMLGLDARNCVVVWSLISIGTLSTSLVHPREVFRLAVATACASIIVVHNHPTGNINPSPQDNAVTLRLAQAGKILGITLLDSIVVNEAGDFWSYRENCRTELEVD